MHSGDVYVEAWWPNSQRARLQITGTVCVWALARDIVLCSWALYSRITSLASGV